MERVEATLFEECIIQISGQALGPLLVEATTILEGAERAAPGWAEPGEPGESFTNHDAWGRRRAEWLHTRT
jgi:hypothetical protein